MEWDWEWMVWTTPTAIFFATIGTILLCMTIWELLSPTVERKGFLPISTTRGDRLFIGLLSSAYFHLIWIMLTELHPGIMTVACVAWLIALIRWG